MVQVIGPTAPNPSAAAMIGNALGTGLGVHFQRGQMQNQQSQLARQLFGDQSEKFANLPIEAQMNLAKLFQQQKNQDEISKIIASLENKNTFIENIENTNEIPVNERGKKLSIPESNIPKLSDQEIAAITLKNPEMGKIFQAQKTAAATKQTAQEKEKNRIFEADRDYHSKVSRPIVESANERLKVSNIQKGTREQLKRDIESGNTSGIFPFIVERLGLESFRNPESARFNNAVKNLFVGSLNDIPGARPNQFIERFLSGAQPNIGRSKEANLSVLDLGDLVEDVKDEQARKELEIAKEDRQKYGYVKEDIAERARERMGDYVNHRQEKMAIDIRKRSEDEMTDTDILNEMIGGKIIPGTYVTPRSLGLLYIKNGKDLEKTVKEAKSLGMRFPEYEQ